MKYIFTTLCFLVLWSGLSAQVSGYMGKRIAIDANFHSMASPLAALAVEEPGIRFRYKWNGQVEYVLNNFNSIGIHSDLFSNAKHYDNIQNAYDQSETINSSYSLKVNGFGFNYKKYIRGAMAPTGSFMHFYATYATGNIQSMVTTVSRDEDYYGEVTEYTEIDKKADPITVLVLGMGVGKRVIIANRFTFNFGINYGVPSFLNGEPTPVDTFGDSDTPGYDTWQDAKLYIKRNYGLSTTVGFGILL